MHTLPCCLLFTSFLLSSLIIPGVLTGIPEQPHHTTAYIGNPGQLDILPSVTQYSTDHFWNKNGKKLKAFHRFDRWSALLYTEYAISRCDSLTLNGGYSRVLDKLNGNCQGIEDVELGWKHSLYQQDTLAITSQAIAIIPAGRTKSSIRYGKIGGEIGVLCSDQFQLFCHSGWYDFSIAYRSYQGFPSNQIRTELALGYIFSQKHFLIASSQLYYGLSNSFPKWRSNMIVNNPSYRLLNAQIEYLINLFSHMTATVGAFGHLWGRNVGTNGGFFVGTWLDF